MGGAYAFGLGLSQELLGRRASIVDDDMGEDRGKRLGKVRKYVGWGKDTGTGWV